MVQSIKNMELLSNNWRFFFLFIWNVFWGLRFEILNFVLWNNVILYSTKIIFFLYFWSSLLIIQHDAGFILGERWKYIKNKKKPVQYLLLIIIVLKKIRNLEKLCSLVFKNCIFISMSMLLYYYSWFV